MRSIGKATKPASIGHCPVTSLQTRTSNSPSRPPFPPAYAGRANAGLNVLSTGSAFALQYAIGAVINLWPRNALGGYDPQAYAWAFGLVLGAQVAALLWFLAYRPRGS